MKRRKSFRRASTSPPRSEEHTSELQSHSDLVCRLLLDSTPIYLTTLSLHDALPILNQVKKYAEAAKDYATTAKLAETRAPEILDDQFHFSWGVSLERSGQFDEAAKEFQKSIDLTPEIGRAHV